MKGSEYLFVGDAVELFFSSACPNIANKIFVDIKKSGCKVRICKLQNPRKNALDFYIASRIGELIGSGYQESIVIISNDHGFRSVQEYWRECSDTKKRVLLSNTITEGIISANQANERTRILREQEKMVSKMIDKIVLHAIEEQDFATENFFRTFVDEQVEEEALFAGIVDKIKNGGDAGLVFLDSILGKRPTE